MPDIEALRVLATEAKARADAATPGPWFVARPNRIPPSQTLVAQVCGSFDQIAGAQPHAPAAADNTFIAAARTDVPALADAVLASVDEINSLVRAVAAKNEVLLEMKAELEAARARIAELEERDA